MKSWQEDQLHKLNTIRCEHALFEVIASHARDLGFEYCAYGLRMPLPLTKPKISMFNNYPVDWQRRYKDKAYISVDPTVQHGTHSLLPYIWSDLIASPLEFWEEAHSYGLRVGWAQASRGIDGLGGMLVLARSSESISDVELRDKELKMMWLTQATHLGMSNLLSAKMQSEAKMELTSREIEVLQWTGDGKTTADISQIINISERTVNFHIGNAMAKLNAPNKTAAVVRAAMLGML